MNIIRYSIRFKTIIRGNTGAYPVQQNNFWLDT